MSHNRAGFGFIVEQHFAMRVLLATDYYDIEHFDLSIPTYTVDAPTDTFFRYDAGIDSFWFCVMAFYAVVFVNVVAVGGGCGIHTARCCLLQIY